MTRLDRWTAHDVTGADLASHTARTYLEHSDVRRYLASIGVQFEGAAACDIGAGYGRMTPVLLEVASTVVAFEREPALVEMGRGLWPETRFVRVERLSALPVADNTFDIALIFTVLQHLSDDEAEAIAVEIRRVLMRPGYALLCEETDPLHRWQEHADGSGRFTIGRSVETYTKLLAMELVATSPRRVEATYQRADVGSYMLFRSG
jgi:SAM-dependent methyltransferase